MDIRNVVIAGEGELASRISEMLSQVGVKTTISKLASHFSEADMVIECLQEDATNKKILMSEISKHITEGAVIATTSYIDIIELAPLVKDTARFVSLDFIFNPLQDKFLVQIAKCVQTTDETVEICAGLIKKMGGTAIEVEDSPGLVIDRIMAMVINEAATMYAAKLATIEDIDRVTKLCLNWPMGPFEFADMIGIDNIVATLNLLLQKGYPVTPCRLLTGMMTVGKLGRKSGQGFYTYN